MPHVTLNINMLHWAIPITPLDIDMNKEELVDRELRYLKSITREYVLHTENVVSELRNNHTTLWLTELDKCRLLTLRTWEMKYKVDLKTILQILLPFWEGFLKRRTNNINTKGLGIRITTLTGKKSEQVLKQGTSKLYPNQENRMLFVNQEQERITGIYLKELEKRSDGIRSQSDPSSLYTTDGKPKTLVDFGSPDAFVKYYRKWIKKEQLAREQIRDIMLKNKHRNNPWY